MKILGRVVRIEELDQGQFDVGVRFLEIEKKDQIKIYRILFEQKKHGQFSTVGK